MKKEEREPELKRGIQKKGGKGKVASKYLNKIVQNGKTKIKK